MVGGPVDIVVVEFPNRPLRTELVDILTDLVSANTIHILDLLVVSKDESGAIVALEIDDLDDDVRALLAGLDGEYDSLVSEADIEHIAAGLAAGTTAALIAWENLWLARMAADLQAAQGTVVLHERIPADVVDLAMADLAELASTVSTASRGTS